MKAHIENGCEDFNTLRSNYIDTLPSPVSYSLFEDPERKTAFIEMDPSLDSLIIEAKGTTSKNIVRIASIDLRNKKLLCSYGAGSLNRLYISPLDEKEYVLGRISGRNPNFPNSLYYYRVDESVLKNPINGVRPSVKDMNRDASGIGGIQTYIRDVDKDIAKSLYDIESENGLIEISRIGEPMRIASVGKDSKINQNDVLYI